MYKRSRIQMLIDILKDTDRESVPVIIRYLGYLFVSQEELPVHYFSRYLYKQGIRNIKDYIPNRLAGKIAPIFNDSRVKQVLDNKLFLACTIDASE